MTDDELVREIARAIAKERYRREYGEELEEQFVDGMAARCEAEAAAALARFREIMRERVPYRIDGPGVKGPHASAYLDGQNAARREILGDDA